MRHRFGATLGLFAAITVALVAVASPVAAAKKSGPVVVGTDDEGDWGVPDQPPAGPVGQLLAQDLLEASIGMADATTVSFILTVADLPPIGGWPEITRYVWGLDVGGEYAELDGKFTNYTRGTCDPTSGCPSPNAPRDPGMAPFLIRGNCMTTQNVTTCEEVGLVNAAFDTGAGTITIPVPLELLGAKPGSVIKGGISDFLAVAHIGAFPSTFVSNNGGPQDTMVMDKSFVVPGGKKKPKK